MIAGNRKQCGLEGFQTVKGKIGPDGDNNIALPRKTLPVASEDFPNQPLDPVPPYCVAGPAMHTDPQAIPWQGIRQDNDCKTVPMKPPSGPVYALKLPVCTQQMRLRESIPLQQAQAASCLRPLARRLLMTARPFLVFIRTRKPWVRARLVVLG